MPSFTETAKSKKSQLWNQFQGASYDKTILSSSSPQKSYACQGSRRVLLYHAQVYVFAEQFDIKPLKQLALKNLRHLLISFKSSKDGVDDFVSLLKYAFENTVDLVNAEEKLRVLVVHYAACIIEGLKANTSFQSLLVNNGELGRDLINKLTSRLD